jgi:hypothetical protein
MHHPVVLGTIGNGIFLLNGQGIHICPNAQDWPGPLALDDRYHPGTRHTRLVINSPGGQAIDDKIRR